MAEIRRPRHFADVGGRYGLCRAAGSANALAERVAHGVYGYPDVLPGVAGAVSDWLAREYGWHIEADWLVWLPGLVCGLNVACRAVGEPGDAVLTATPVYPPFMSAPQLSGRELQTALLQEGADGWRWDWAAMEAALTRAPAC